MAKGVGLNEAAEAAFFVTQAKSGGCVPWENQALPRVRLSAKG